MTEPAAGTPVRAPWHLWVIGIVSLLWNAMGALDYVMTQTKNATYLGSIPPEQLEYFYSFPSWAVAAWATAVWGGVLGSLLLLPRKPLAAPVFLVSFVAMALTTIYNFLLSDGLKIMGTGAAAFSAVIFVVALLLVVYSRRMRAAGVLA